MLFLYQDPKFQNTASPRKLMWEDIRGKADRAIDYQNQICHLDPLMSNGHVREDLEYVFTSLFHLVGIEYEMEMKRTIASYKPITQKMFNLKSVKEDMLTKGQKFTTLFSYMEGVNQRLVHIVRAKRSRSPKLSETDWQTPIGAYSAPMQTPLSSPFVS